MRDAAPQTIYLKDYTPFGFTVEKVELTFRLDPHATRVASRIRFAPNAQAKDRRFFLHGENLTLIHASIDGEKVTPDITAEGLTCPVPDAPFTWEAEVEIDPKANTALEGLYMSSGMYCTQCEAEGFPQDHLLPRPPRRDGPLHRARGRPAARAALQRQPRSRKATGLPSGTIHGPSPPISSRWWRVI
jgi:aminopeptidase N